MFVLGEKNFKKQWRRWSHSGNLQRGPLRGTRDRFLLGVVFFSPLLIAQAPLASSATLPNAVNGKLQPVWVSGSTITVIAFLKCTATSCDAPSRFAVQQINSLRLQYTTNQVRTIAIAETAAAGESISLINLFYDWHLASPLLLDAEGKAAQLYKPESLPQFIALDDTGKPLGQVRLGPSPAPLGLFIKESLAKNSKP